MRTSTVPKMTRQHFEFIADTIQRLQWASKIDLPYVAQVFADELAATNPNFNRDKFIRRATEGR